MPLLQGALAEPILIRVPQIQNHVDGREAVANIPRAGVLFQDGLQLLDRRPVPFLLAVRERQPFADDRVVRSDFAGLLEFLQGLVIPALFQVGRAEVHVDGALVVVQGDALAVGGDGAVHLALGVVDGPEVRPGERVVRVEFGGLQGMGLGLLEVPQAEVHDPQVHASGDVVRVQAHNLLVGVGGLGVALQRLVHPAEAILKRVLAGLLGHRRPVGVDGVLKLPLLAVGVAEADVGQGQVVVQLDGGLELPDRLVQAPRLQVQVPRAVVAHGVFALASGGQADRARQQQNPRCRPIHSSRPPSRHWRGYSTRVPGRLSKQSLNKAA